MAKSFVVALFGLAMAFAGINLLASAVFYTAVVTVFSYLGISLGFLLSTSMVGGIFGAILLVFGSRLFFQNETALVRTLIGLVGVYLLIVGSVVAALTIASSPTGITIPLGIMASMILWSAGLTFMGYGFNLKFLAPMKELMGTYKGLVGAGQ